MAENFSDSSNSMSAAQSPERRPANNEEEMPPPPPADPNQNINVSGSLQSWPTDVLELIAQQNRNLARAQVSRGFISSGSGNPERRVDVENYLACYPDGSNPRRSHVVVTEVVRTTRRFTTSTESLNRFLSQHDSVLRYQENQLSPLYRTQPVSYFTPDLNNNFSTFTPETDLFSPLLQPTSSSMNPGPSGRAPPSYCEPSPSGMNNPGDCFEGDLDLRPSSDGRIHSLPHRKHGPYRCPKCRLAFDKNQSFAAHVSSHYVDENSEQRNRRLIAKSRNRNLDFRVVNTRFGMTLIPNIGRPRGRGFQNRRMEAQRDAEAVARYIANLNKGRFGRGRGRGRGYGGSRGRGHSRGWTRNTERAVDIEEIFNANTGGSERATGGPIAEPSSRPRATGVVIREPTNTRGRDVANQEPENTRGKDVLQHDDEDDDDDDGMNRGHFAGPSFYPGSPSSTSRAVHEPATAMSERAPPTDLGPSNNPSSPPGSSSHPDHPPGFPPNSR